MFSRRKRFHSTIAFLFCLQIANLLLPSRSSCAPTEIKISLDEAIDQALHRSSRSRVIQGNVSVAEQNYQARRLNFYFPSISLNGNAPSYSIDESYRLFGASPFKQLYKTRDVSFRSFLQLHQNLITGGDLTIDANLASSDNRYPNTGLNGGSNIFLNERSRLGYLEVALAQPLLKPSEPKNELKNREDDLGSARLARREGESALAKEVASTYLGALRLSLQEELAQTRMDAAREKTRIDSLKWQDAVISEEIWLTSASAALDAELSLREAYSEGNEIRQQLALLLDQDPGVAWLLSEPAVVHPPGLVERQALLSGWEKCLAVRQAEQSYQRSLRAARFAASGRGLSGDIKAAYSLGRGNVRRQDQERDQIKTLGWQLALNVSYPLWDGGAADAAAHAARYTAEQARLEWEKSKQVARAEIARLVDLEAVSLRRMEILRKQVGLAENRLGISTARFEDGRVSQYDLLQSKIAFLEAKAKYYEELKNYWTTRIDLEGRFGE